jgi:hypothetical protein
MREFGRLVDIFIGGWCVIAALVMILGWADPADHLRQIAFFAYITTARVCFWGASEGKL